MMACEKLAPSISSLHTKLGSFICWNGGRWGSSEAFDAVPLTVTGCVSWCGCICCRSRLPWVSVPLNRFRGSRTGVRLTGEGVLLVSLAGAAVSAWAPVSSWFSHLRTWLGVQFVHGFPLRAQAQLLQRPLPLHRQHWGGIMKENVLPFNLISSDKLF